MNTYLPLNSVAFPQDLKICLSDPEKCNSKLAGALVTKSTRDAFKAWADQHPSFVRLSPLMNAIIKQIEIKENLPPGTLTKFTDICVSIVRAVLGERNPLATIIEQRHAYDFTDGNNFEDVKQSLPFFEEYLELGLIHKNQVVQALSIQSKDFGQTPLHPLDDLFDSNKIEAQYLLKLKPLLKHLSPNELIEVFSIQDKRHFPPLFYLEAFEIMLPFLQALPMNLLVSIIAIRSSNDACLLVNPILADKALVLLEDRSNNEREQFFKLLAMYPKIWASNFKSTLPFLEKMSLKQQARVLSRQPQGVSCLHLETGIKAAWPLIVKFPPHLFIKVMTSKSQTNQQPLDFITHLDRSMLDKMKGDQFLHLLSNATPGLFKDLWETYPPVKELKSHQLLQILCSIAAIHGHHKAWKDLFTIIDPLFSNSDLMQIMTSRSNQGKTLLHSETGLAAALPILNKLRSYELVSLLSIQDATGQTPLISPRGFALLKPLLESLSPDDSLKLLTLKDANGIYPLIRLTHVSLVWPFDTFSAWPFLKKMNLEQSTQFLSLAPLNIFAGVIATPLFKNLSNEELVKILMAQAAEGKTAFWTEAFAVAKPKIEKLSIDQFIQILSAKDPKGDPLLFTKHGFKAITPLIKNMPAEYQENALSIQNADGLNLNDITLYAISNKWLKSAKVSASMSATISYQDYNNRVLILKKNVHALWDTVTKGLISRKVDPKLLEVNGKIYSSAEILFQLNSMIEYMVNKKAWLGTPPALCQDELHSFYSVMLVNFERLAAELAKRNHPVEIAGVLTNIAAVRLEERCASAYQAEIEQKSHAISENMDLNSFVKLAASNSLAAIIETIIRTVYGSDVHDLIQFQYAAGLTTAKDHLALISPEAAIASIEKHFIFSEFYSAFSHGISNEQAMEWLKGNTPDTFGPEYKEVEKRLRNQEESILEECKKQLREFFSESEVTKLSQFLTAPPAPALSPDKLLPANREELLKTTLQTAINKFKGALQQNPSLPDIHQLCAQIVQAHNEEDCKEIVKDLIQKIKANLDKTNTPNYLKNLQILASLSGKLPAEVGKIESFHKMMRALELTPKQLLNFLRVKQNFDSKIEQLGAILEDSPLSIVFVPTTHRLPSLACEDARRIKYNADFMTSRGKMLIHILEKLGTIEKKTEKSKVQQSFSMLTPLFDE